MAADKGTGESGMDKGMAEPSAPPLAPPSAGCWHPAPVSWAMGVQLLGGDGREERGMGERRERQEGREGE